MNSKQQPKKQTKKPAAQKALSRYAKWQGKINPYFETIVDPFNVRGVRIPDLDVHKSCPFSVTDRRTLTVNAGGVCGVSYGIGGTLAASPQASLVPISNNAIAGAANFAVGMVLGTGATTAGLYPAIGAGTWIQLTQWTTTSDSIPASFTNIRLVSAGLAINFLGNFTDCAGKITIASCPRFQQRSTLGIGLTVDQLANLPSAKIVPVNQMEGASCCYRPTDNRSLAYTSTDVTHTPASVSDWDQIAQSLGGEMYAVVSGATAGQTFQVTFVGNYEGIPRWNTLSLLGSTPSPVDPIGLASAMSMAANVTPTIGDAKAALGTATGQSTGLRMEAPHPEDVSFTDKIMKGAEKLEALETKAKKFSPLGRLALDALEKL
jgi:hypothetical protein